MQWRPVATTDPLTASIYRYGRNHGWPLENQSARAEIRHHCRDVKRRDGQCWVTVIDDPLVVNSHILPEAHGGIMLG